MKHTLTKQSIINKTVQVGASTLGSRCLGIVRESLTAQYLGAGIVADAFITAWKLPNALRKIFAEGALSVAFIPTLIKLVKDGKKDDAHALISAGFIFFEGVVLLLCVGAMLYAENVIWFMAPGFSAEKIAIAAPYLRILMPFILFISSSALIAGALASMHHFFVPAVSSMLLNFIFILSLLICTHYALPVTYLCFFIVGASMVQFVWHIITFFQLGFSFGTIRSNIYPIFKTIFIKFCNCLISISAMELTLFLATQMASWLPTGSIAVIYYAYRFMAIPFSVFVTAFSTILLPHLSHITTYAPKRLSFYLLESSKLICWITIPTTFFILFFARDIFVTIFLSDKFSLEKAELAAATLQAFSTGLFFFSLNRLLLNIYYALHNTLIPTLITLFGLACNALLSFIFMQMIGVTGIAYGTILATAMQTGLYFTHLHYYANVQLYGIRFVSFALRYLIQLSIVGCIFIIMYHTTYSLFFFYAPKFIVLSLLTGLLFWSWVIPLYILTLSALYYSKKWFHIPLYFLD